MGRRRVCGRGIGDVGARALHDRTAGHAVVDAMVALLIISMTVVLGLGAVRQAVTTARLTKEVQAADILLRNILVDGPRSFTETRGQSGGFVWTLTTAVTGADRPIEVCRRHVLAVHQRSARRYETSTLETCPEASGP